MLLLDLSSTFFLYNQEKPVHCKRHMPKTFILAIHTSTIYWPKAKGGTFFKLSYYLIRDLGERSFGYENIFPPTYILPWSTVNRCQHAYRFVFAWIATGRT